MEKNTLERLERAEKEIEILKAVVLKIVKYSDYVAIVGMIDKDGKLNPNNNQPKQKGTGS